MSNLEHKMIVAHLEDHNRLKMIMEKIQIAVKKYDVDQLRLTAEDIKERINDRIIFCRSIGISLPRYL